MKFPGTLEAARVDGVLTESKWIKGTYIVVQDITERDAIPTGVRVDGTKCYVVSDKKEYRWEENKWNMETQPTFPTFPTDSKIYGIQNGQWVEITINGDIEQKFSQLNEAIESTNTELSSTQRELENLDNVSVKFKPYVPAPDDEGSLKNMIEMDNGSPIAWKGAEKLENSTFNLITLSPSNVAEIGSQMVHLDLNTVDNVTINGNRILLSVKEVEDVVNESLKEVDSALALKQDTLISGTNIKTINGKSILGAGNLIIQSGGTASIATEDSIGGILSSEYSVENAGEYSVSTVKVDSNTGKATVKLPSIEEATTQQELVKVLNGDEQSQLVIIGGTSTN